jgi:hypothetical protein
VEDLGGLRFIYDKNIAAHLKGKVINYQTAPQEGFSVTADGPAGDCGGCSC